MEEPRRLGGRYELSHVLGRGGMAEVYLAQDTRLGRTVAVKTLRADLARDPSFQARFRREAQSAASLNHPAIVAVYDTGEDYVDNISIPYIVMEYVDGSTLRELLHSGRKLLPERTLEMCTGILQALEYSHRAGIVHRDIKPANVMLTRAGQVKVMDFGIARAMGDSGMTMTQTSAVIGTAQYLSPEQAKGETVDARSDLYSTGCLLYELLTVRPPFIGDSPVAVAYQHVREEPQPPSTFDHVITPEMDAIVLRALVKDPAYRYQSADEMRADIEACLDGRPVAAAVGMGGPGYGGYDGYGNGYEDQTQGHGMPGRHPADAGATAMLPPVQDNGGYGGHPGGGPGGYDNGGYDTNGGRGSRRQPPPRKSRASTILLVVAGILVLVGAVLIGRVMFPDKKDPGTLPAPDFVGQTFQEAGVTANNADLKLVKGTDEECEKQPKGKICSQSPEAATTVKTGDTITVKVSSGAPKVSVPDVLSLKFEDAEKQLKDKGFKVERRNKEADRTPGTVFDQDPQSGRTVETGTTITLTVAKEKAKSIVPNLAGLDENAAKQALKNAGLVLGSTQEKPDSATPGTIIGQEIPPNQEVAPGTAINVTKAAAAPPQKPTVPSLKDKTVGAAKGELAALGLTLNVQGGPGDDNAVITDQNPKAGDQVDPNSAVTVRTKDPNNNGNNNNGGNFWDQFRP
ncbi:Stk1 family PASTA domain-containing Ser/Thr kinase [Streptomyces sp. BI20]|uniref:Stk1 family PASTA domain-containing Ser/Thr kinase n=1 Tax=Streptomyces sp. BI20 TaxID=3403460 RepID=UPI003C74D4CC